jgi:hypothetical protein
LVWASKGWKPRGLRWKLNRFERRNGDGPHAAYLFKEDGEGWKGVRLHLRKVKEEKDTELLRSLKRRRYEGDEEGRHLVFFQVEKVLPLIGPGDEKKD